MHVQPFLMFQGQAEAAMNYYQAVFEDSEIVLLQRYEEGQAGGVPGTIYHGQLRVGDLQLRFFDSGVQHGFTFTPAISLFVTCRDEAEIRRVSEQLLQEGTALMPLNNYGFSQLFAWVQDRFGISWQLNLE